MLRALMVTLAALCSAAPLGAQHFTEAQYHKPTSVYPHGVLGDDQEWAELHVKITRTAGSEGSLFSGSASVTYHVSAPEDMVYEDIAPRLWDVTGDGQPEVVVIESHQSKGARLSILGIVEGRPEYIATTPHIGTRFRWLAPVGAADFDGDGHIEIAFVDRPHLAKTLRIWRYTPDSFQEIATLRGVTNHRIGEDFITGGLRDCGDGPEMVIVDAAWQWITAVRLDPKSTTRLAPFTGQNSVAKALDCS